MRFSDWIAQLMCDIFGHIEPVLINVVVRGRDMMARICPRCGQEA